MSETEAAAVWMPIELLMPWAQNPKVHDNGQIEKIKRSIAELGFGAPLIARPKADKFEVIAGHGRLMAAQRLELDRVPVRVLDLDDRQAQLLAVADNRLGEPALAPWDAPALAEILKGFEDDLDLSGFTSTDLDTLLAGLAAPTSDDWAQAFEAKGDTSAVDGRRQITFVLEAGDHARLLAHLGQFHQKKNEAIIRWLDDSAA